VHLFFHSKSIHWNRCTCCWILLFLLLESRHVPVLSRSCTLPSKKEILRESETDDDSEAIYTPQNRKEKFTTSFHYTQLKEGTQVGKIGPDFSRRSSPQIHANALPPSLCPSVQTLLQRNVHLLYIRNTVLGLGLQTLNQYPHNNPGVQCFFLATWREKKKKK
jgi:hypothetical protein